MNATRTRESRKGLVFPLILILAGLVAFLTRNGMIERQLVLQLLPLVPMAIGGALLVSRLNRRAD
ncbi:hypothetical protein [Noviherbaspirillum denitrificans]|uniref:Uncharacterized protein n=1 Tax=Noviherbaspirillum denitrificans TaxID=1968433 RepID=A0A254T7R7_9BURK|nr:hypothetical protein [Noviherbaspirillum denitrificans]OWW18615.1 hypothetical protein AYR66_03235 [Noviherbaspirillum denitrificans]